MGRKAFAVEEIIRYLREVEILCGQGKTIGEAVRQIGENLFPAYGHVLGALTELLKEMGRVNIRDRWKTKVSKTKKCDS